MTIVGKLSQYLISFRITHPSQGRPTELGNISMEISRFTCVEVSPVVESIALNGSNNTTLSLLCIKITHLHSWIGDEDASEGLLNILEICPRPKLRETRR